jgi:hypothetical protein
MLLLDEKGGRREQMLQNTTTPKILLVLSMKTISCKTLRFANTGVAKYNNGRRL